MRVLSSPLSTFRSSPALEDFMLDESSRILVRAANRVGKSEHAACKLARIMLLRGNKRYRAVGVNYKQSISVISRLLAKYIPTSQLAEGCTYTETNGWSHNLIRLKNGTTCQITSNDQHAIAHAGADLDGVWLDEIPKPDILMESLKRVMSRVGWVWITTTPIGRPTTYLRDMIEHLDSPWKEYVVSLSLRNCPWYSPEQLEKWLFEASLSPGSYRQTIHGDWEGTSQDRIFSGYDDSCLISDSDPSPKQVHFGIGIDHGESAGKQVALLVCWNAQGIWILDEVVSKSSTTPEQDAKDIYKMIVRNQIDLHHIDRIVGDVNSAGKLSGGRKVNDILSASLCREAGYHKVGITIQTPMKSAGSVDLGCRLLNAGFLRKQVKVHPSCKNLIHCLQHWNGDEDLKHLPDAARYVLLPVLEQFNTKLAIPQRYQL